MPTMGSPQAHRIVLPRRLALTLLAIMARDGKSMLQLRRQGPNG